MKKNYGNLIVLLISVFFIFSYNNIFMTVTPLYLIEIGGNQFHVGLQSTIFLLVAVALRFIFGPFADVKGNKLTMLIGAGAFLFASVFFIFCNQVWQVIFLRVIQAVGLSAYFPCASAIVINYAPADKVGKYVGIYRLVTVSTLLIGPFFTLSLINEKGYHLYYIVMLIVAFIGFIILLPIKTNQKLKDKSKRQKHCFSMKKNVRIAVPMYVTTFMIAISYGLLFNFTIIFISTHTNISNPGQFFTLFGLGGLIASVTLGVISDYFGRLRTVIFTLVILGISLGCFFYIPRMPWLIYFAGIFSGIGYSGGIIVLMAWVSESVNSQFRTSALAVQQNCIDLGIAFGSSAFGLAFQITNNSPIVFGFIGVSYFVYAAGLYILNKNKKSLHINLH